MYMLLLKQEESTEFIDIGNFLPIDNRSVYTFTLILQRSNKGIF